MISSGGFATPFGLRRMPYSALPSYGIVTCSPGGSI